MCDAVVSPASFLPRSRAFQAPDRSSTNDSSLPVDSVSISYLVLTGYVRVIWDEQFDATVGNTPIFQSGVEIVRISESTDQHNTLGSGYLSGKISW
jgi:hypothetical protein